MENQPPCFQGSLLIIIVVKIIKIKIYKTIYCQTLCFSLVSKLSCCIRFIIGRSNHRGIILLNYALKCNKSFCPYFQCWSDGSVSFIPFLFLPPSLAQFTSELESGALNFTDGMLSQ